MADMKNKQSKEIWRMMDVIRVVQATYPSGNEISANTIIAGWIIIVLLGKEKARSYYGAEKADHVIAILKDLKISLCKTDLKKAEILGVDPDLLNFERTDSNSGKNNPKSATNEECDNIFNSIYQ